MSINGVNRLDGDGIAILALGNYDVTIEEIREMNNSLMGLGGYAHLYGEDLPYADFVSASDKNGKKSLRKPCAMINSTIKDDNNNEVAITRQFVGDYAARVASHYKGAVGTSYGLCSQLIFAAADSVAAGSATATNRLTACLIVWRLIYEGLALSGYSAKAARVMDILNLASAVYKTQLVNVSPDGQLAAGFEKLAGYELVSGSSLLAKEFGLNFDAEVFQMIIASRSITRVIPKLEGFGGLTKYWGELAPTAVKYGALRRISQGDNRVAVELGLIEEAELIAMNEQVGVAISRLYAQQSPEMKAKLFANAKLGELVDSVCAFHSQIVVTNAQVLDSYQ